MSEMVRVAGTGDLKPGENKIVDVNGEKVALFNVNGEYFAIGNICPHRGGSLGEGILEEDVVACPLHGWKFNVKTGVSPMIPNAKVASYKVKVEDDNIFVSLQ